MFIPPMLASPFPKPNPKVKKPFVPFSPTPNTWVAEEKYDGQRIGLEINRKYAKLFSKTGVYGWTRYANIEHIPAHILEVLDEFPDCYIDGELMAPGKRSYGTMDHSNRDELVFYAFDLIQSGTADLCWMGYEYRRELLINLLESCNIPKDGPVRLAESRPVNSMEEIYAYRDEVWSRDGEGLILKERGGAYMVGKRSKSWIKIKKLQSAVLTITGFEESRGDKVYRGKHAIVCLVDDEGYTCTVKTKNDQELANFDHAALVAASMEKPHPAIGCKLRIEFQERTPDGLYREPRWDRWENE